MANICAQYFPFNLLYSGGIYINYLPFNNISFDILSGNYYNSLFGLMVKLGLPVVYLFGLTD